MRLPWPRGPRTALEAARAAYVAARRYGNLDHAAMAGTWCELAVASGNAGEAAEAYWERVVAAAEGSARAVPRARREVYLGSGQGVLAEAGYWQLRAGDPEKAVRILEFGRGVLMRRTVGAVTPAQRAALVRGGHAGLLASYLEAVDEVAGLLRAQYRTTTPAGPGIRGHDPLMAARESVQTLEREIGDVLTIQPGPPAYAEIQLAASAAPLVYVAAARAGGYAVIVPDRGPARRIDLPALDRDTALDCAGRLGTRSRVGEVPERAVRDAIDWLTPALTTLAAALSGRPVVTLVPVGVLALLPIHASLDVSSAGAPAVRHTPSARVLPERSDPIAAGAGVLAVLAERPCSWPGGPALHDLDLARPQAELLRGLYGDRLTVRADAHAAPVLAELAGAEVCHFVCHGVFDAENALNSSLVLADRRLTVGEILAGNAGRQRLVILGACESSVPDHRILDETVSFPGAMVQAGASSVVAALWQVREPAAALVLLHFHVELRKGRRPAEALAAAQRWLRTATYADISTRYPGLYVDRLCSPARIPFGDPVDWAAFTCTGA